MRNYQELVDRVVDLIGRGSIRKKVPGWIQLAESEAVTFVRDLREIKYKFSGTLTSGTETLTLPDGVIGVDAFQLDTNPVRVVRQGTVDQLIDRRSLSAANSDTYPIVYTWNGGRDLEMAPTPQTNEAFTIYYTGSMVDVDELKVTSNILEQAPNYLLYACAWHSAVYTRNAEQEARFGQIRDKYLQGYRQLMARSRDTMQVGGFIRPGDHPQTTGTSG